MNLKLHSFNVNGLRAIHRKELLIPYIEKEQPDILCLQETKSSRDQYPKELFDLGYEVYNSDSEFKKGYSGVAIFTKLKASKVSTSLENDKRFDVEGRIIRLDFDEFKTPFTLFNIYFPNGQMSDERLEYKMQFYSAFEELVEKLRKKGKTVIVCGDVNTAHREIDLARPKDNEKTSGFLPIERAWITRFLEFGWIDTLREINGDVEGAYSWWSMRAIGARTRNVGWRIDYFFINKESKTIVKDAYILPNIKGSDHCPIGVEIVLSN